jgi:hypothetical protein
MVFVIVIAELENLALLQLAAVTVCYKGGGLYNRNSLSQFWSPEVRNKTVSYIVFF